MKTAVWLAVAMALGAVAACGDDGGGSSSGSSKNDGGSNEGGSGDSATGAGATGGSGMSDEAYCDEACQTLVDCGWHASAQDCSTGCLAPTGAPFLACIKPVGDDCDALAGCVWQSFCAGGEPSGTATCQEGQNCQGANCVGTSGDPLVCTCACATTVSAADAMELLAIDSCASTECGTPCGPTGNVTDCDACLALECAADDAACD